MSSWFFSSSKTLQSPAEKPSRSTFAQSLLHYETGSPPPSARVDPKFKLQPRRPMRLWDYFKIGPILAAKATEITSDVLSHHIWGPRRKSWGIEMTIVTSVMRGAERHSSFVDIGSIRMLMSIGGLVPLPSDALVTPVTFHVKRRQLKGILAEYDAKEDGTRVLSGEWVVGRKTWQRLQMEWKAASQADTSPKVGGGSPNAPKPSPLKRKELVVLYIHGGAYTLSSAAVQRIISIPLAKYTDCRVFALDYRLAPETRFPGPLHDVVSAYFRFIDELHIPPENIIVSGDSAGGGLTLALLMYLRDNAYPLPAGAILMSPWVDLTMSCESWESNAPYDVVPFPTPDNHMNPVPLYLGDQVEEFLTHPYASPLFGDFTGLPPLLIQSGDCEVLRDEITLLAHKATSHGVQVMHELYEDAIHVFHAYPFLQASRRSFESMRNFVRYILPQYQSRSPQLLAAVAELGLEREIENDRAVVVSGDGEEQPKAEVESFGKKEKTTNDSDDGVKSEESDDEPSWVRTPAWPAAGSATNKDEKIDHVEIVNVEDIPDLHLTPLTAADEAPPATTTTKSHHYRRTSSPRRIQSTSSLASALSSISSSSQVTDPAHEPQSQHAHQSPSHPSSPHPSHRAFQFNLLSSSSASSSSASPSSPPPKRHPHTRSHSTLAPLTITPLEHNKPPIQPPLPSPSIRKRRMSFGLTIPSRKKSMRLKETAGAQAEAAADIAVTDSGRQDVKSLIEDWTLHGPANQTVVVSAAPSPTSSN